MATVPVCPPASVPWATTKSQPLATALMAWRTLPHIEPTSTLASCSASTTSRGTPSPATKIRAPPAITSSMPGLHLAGERGQQVDAERLGGQLADRGHLGRQLVGRIVEAPSVPIPPASLTAATSRWYDTPPIPASMTGCSMSSSSVSRVRITADGVRPPPVASS